MALGLYIALDSAIQGDWSFMVSRRRATGPAVSAPDLNNRGVAYFALGRPKRAAALFRAAVRAEPSNAQFLRHFGLALTQMDKLKEAVAAFDEAVRLDPADPAHHRSLAAALLRKGDVRQALAHASIAVSGDPENSDAGEILAGCLAKSGRIGDAVRAYSKVLSHDDRRVSCSNNLGGLRALQGDIEEAVGNFSRAEDLSSSPAIGSNRLLTLHYSERDPNEMLREHLEWASRHFSSVPRATAYRNDTSTARRLRVGYVSPDFRQHSVAHLIEPVLAAHDPAAVEVFLYPTTPRYDDVTARLRSHSAGWHPLDPLGDDEAADLIRKHQVDILVDLAGHTSGNRLGIFARKPAPVQVTYCGYPDTTGLRTVDYRLTDEFADPIGASEHLHTERLWRLPSGFVTYLPPAYAPGVSTLPADHRGNVTFGCFAMRQKITGAMIALWADVLLRVPGARLIIKNGQVTDGEIAEALREQFNRREIARDRVELCGITPGPEHLDQYAEIDMMLDTFPYNGTVGTCEALWMGVPVLTLAGKTHASRVGVSLLSRVGLTGWVATSSEDYVCKAVAFGRNPVGLASIRKSVRERFRKSSLGDAIVLTRELEQAYRGMWAAWCGASQSD